MKKTELLLPGGSLAKVKTAFLYGADSVYAGTPDMSLRVKSEFSLEDLKEVSKIAKRNSKKLYLTLNLFSHNKDIEKLPAYLNTISEINPDGLLIADPGIFAYVKKHMPNINLHVSTQANVCSSLSVDFWKDQGAALCVLAREVTYEELKEIRQNCKDIKLEAFVHGSMCMTYSGRCLLSNFMAERGANQGSCAHNCRWNYKVKAKLKDGKIFDLTLNDENKELLDFYLEEEFREGEYFEIQEDDMGSYILNSKDLCLMPVLDKYLEIGVDTFKIEGRNKGEYYAAITARAYRYAIDSWYENPGNWNYKPFMEELETIPNRGYTLAFHNGRLTNLAHNYDVTKTLSSFMFAGIVLEYENDCMYMEIRNFLEAGDVLEFISPFYMEPIRLRLYEYQDSKTGAIKTRISPGRAGQCIRIPLSAFHMQDPNSIKDILPPLSVVRKSNLQVEDNKFLKRNNIAFKFENNKASLSLLDRINGQIKEIKTTDNTQPKQKDYKGYEATCCSKGCNGCLVFWQDDKYAKMRDKLSQKKIGEKLIKHVDF